MLGVSLLFAGGVVGLAWRTISQIDRVVPRLARLLEKPRKTPAPAPTPVVTANPEFSTACRDLWNLLLELDLERAADRSLFEPLPFNSGCTSAPAEFGQLQMLYFGTCAMWLRPDLRDGPPVSQECLASLFLLRSAWAAWLKKDVPIETINDLPELGDRLAGAFAKLFSNEPQPAALRAVAERILEIDPRIYGAAKAAVIAEVLTGLKAKATPVEWSRLNGILERARGLARQDDPELKTLERIIETAGFEPTRVKESSRERLRDTSLSAEDRAATLHELAYAEWKLGNQDESVALLQQAIGLSPSHPDWLSTQARILKPGANPDTFEMQFPIGVDFRSLL